MWTLENRRRYDRSKLRYPSDMTDDEWALIKPLIPPAKRGGNKRTVDVREVVNGVMFILSTGCQWASLRIPTQTSRRFRCIPAGDSDGSQPVIPAHSSHP